MFGLIDLKDGQAAPFFSNLIGDGIFPNGFGAIFITMITVNFAFQGTELIGIAAGKAKIRKKRCPAPSNRRSGGHWCFSACPYLYWRD